MVSRVTKERTEEMSTFPTKILLATDASQDAVKAAQMASDLANVSGSELHVLHIGNMKDFHIAPGAEQTFATRSGTYGEIQEKAEKTLEEAVRQVEEVGGTVAQAHVRTGDPDDEIIRFCEEQGDFGLIVIGSRGLGPVKRKLMGSVSESVVRHAHLPVLVTRA
jgi:nucleotide-binding universal stress UspA family protein